MREKTNDRPVTDLGVTGFASAQQAALRTVAVAKLLHGLPLSQAQYVLREAERLLMQAHVADVDSERFKALSEAIVAFSSE